MRENRKYLNQYEYPSFWESALTIKGSVTPKVLPNVVFCTIYAAIVSVGNIWLHAIELPISPFEYAGVLMGLLLVFRVNAGYDRWWEARKLWGTIVNNSRNLAIVVKNYGDAGNERLIHNTLGLISAMPYLMKNHLRHSTSTEEVASLLDTQDYFELQHWQHKPNYISSKIAMNFALMFKDRDLDQFAFLKAEELRSSLIDCQGACERILKTPMPFVMAIKTRRFILLFLLILPVALINHLYINAIVTALVAYALLSLDQIGIELQNPFATENLSHLPLTDICKNIQKDIHEIGTSFDE